MGYLISDSGSIRQGQVWVPFHDVCVKSHQPSFAYSHKVCDTISLAYFATSTNWRSKIFWYGEYFASLLVIFPSVSNSVRLKIFLDKGIKTHLLLYRSDYVSSCVIVHMLWSHINTSSTKLQAELRVFYHRSELYFITTTYMYSKQQQKQRTIPLTKYQPYCVMQKYSEDQRSYWKMGLAPQHSKLAMLLILKGWHW